MPEFNAPSNKERTIEDLVAHYRPKVAAGIEFLDTSLLAPARWRRWINLARLNQRSATDDIAGQIFQTFDRALRVLDITEERARELGFDADVDHDKHHEALTKAWHEALIADRDERKAA